MVLLNFNAMLLSMKRISVLLLCTLACSVVWSQTITNRLETTFKIFEADPQLRGAVASLYVTNAKTGEIVFSKNSTMGLAPASTQKIITSASAYELLGKQFKYKTSFGYSGALIGNELKGVLLIKPSGDPTFGSWRWQTTNEIKVVQRVLSSIEKAGIKKYNGVAVDVSEWAGEAIPDGWMWQDIGNYYGAGAAGLNWRENQYDLALQSGNSIGGAVSIAATKPKLYGVEITTHVKSAAKGTGDNAYIYFVPGANAIQVRGTIPVEEAKFVISGAMPSPQKQFAATLEDSLKARGIVTIPVETGTLAEATNFTLLHTETSPPLDSVIYWFNKKSINLYGEALVKTIAHQKTGVGSTDVGVKRIKALWKSKGVENWELNMVDGSGLSPLNRVTTHAQVQILQHAKAQPWFDGFYHSLPEYNGMKLKSGTINGVKGFCGYHTSKDGKSYTLSFIVNNYNGSASALVQKMYKVLDVLK